MLIKSMGPLLISPPCLKKIISTRVQGTLLKGVNGSRKENSVSIGHYNKLNELHHFASHQQFSHFLKYPIALFGVPIPFVFK